MQNNSEDNNQDNNQVSNQESKPDNNPDNSHGKLQDENQKPTSNVGKWVKQVEGMKFKNGEQNWADVGTEVILRKTLLLAAKEDLEKLGVGEKCLELAATDVFVEKAQIKITKRAERFFRLGVITAVFAFVVLIVFAWILHSTKLKDIFGFDITKDFKPSGYLAWVVVIKSTTFAAVFFTMTVYLLSLSRAFLHEATTLYNRRHALRFGRLFVYLKRGELTLKELEDAFKWNAEFTTAFKDVQIESKTWLSKLAEIPGRVVKIVVDRGNNLREVEFEHEKASSGKGQSACEKDQW